TFGKKINEVSKLVVHELGQTPKMFSVQNAEEYTHDGQLVCTLDDLRPVLLALSDKDAVPLGMSKEESLARWQTLRNQLDGILKEIA
ncbi:hypothetical protein ACE4Z5_26620, partial [Salmonella enterica]|uniref:hypothetical protein n=1 Tax=Salmonella enterica TaxID=28901 RepID=UPI003D26898F